MSFGRIRAENQLFFLNTGKIEGIQSYSINNNLGTYTVKYFGEGNKSLNQNVNSAQYCDISLQSYLLQEDVFISLTGDSCLNMFVLNGQNDTNTYFLVSGYMSNYSAKYSPNTIPEINSTFRFYNNVGNIPTGSLDTNTFIQLSGIQTNTYNKFNGLLANSNYINLSTNESSGNRVISFGFDMNLNRIPIYNIGYPPFKRADLVFPIDVTCDLEFEADPSFIDFSLTGFPSQEIVQNIQLDIYSHLSNSLFEQYKFYNMNLVSNEKKLNVDGNVIITRKYVGQIFSSYNVVSGLNIWDFGFVASGINFFIDWGFTSQSSSTTLDFGSV
jgi:hypothetical protein